MKILLCHNYYQQPGGEDHVFEAEARLLASRGHAVVRFTRHNDAIHQMSRWEAAAKTIWNREVYRELRAVIQSEHPDVLHATNCFPLISPAAYAAARDEGVPVIQSLHNYRLLCPKAQLLRGGRVCEQCLGRAFPWPGVAYGCYRDDRAATAVAAAMLGVHRAIGTWRRAVDQYIALTEFARRKFVQAGLPADRITVKPNFLPQDPGPGSGGGGYAVFAGRLSPEKGIDTLLEAWTRLQPTIALKIAGDGPLADRVRRAAEGNPAIQWLGRRPHAQVLDWIGHARLLVFPSCCYETFGLAIAEAFAKGTPVVASRLGAMSELVADGRTGLLFDPGNPADLAAKIKSLWCDRRALAHMRYEARREFERKYTAQANYERLISIYKIVLARKRRSRRMAGPPMQPRAASAPPLGLSTDTDGPAIFPDHDAQGSSVPSTPITPGHGSGLM